MTRVLPTDSRWFCELCQAEQWQDRIVYGVPLCFLCLGNVAEDPRYAYHHQAKNYYLERDLMEMTHKYQELYRVVTQTEPFCMPDNPMLLFQYAVGTWAEQQFPASSVRSIHLHALREARELVLALEQWEREQMPVKDDVVWPTVLEEMADLFLLFCHLAHKRRFQLFDVIRQKFQIVQARQYGEPDAEGVTEHEEAFVPE